ncbi:MAG: efflux RND transporter permease subunit [Balneolaceae bacterium]|nr:efflux RND transporter permease subunit [Balneolaceae bacterium]
MAEIDEIEKLPEMKGINIYEMHNQATGIISSLLDLLNAGLLGGLFSIIVLYLFLRQVSTTLIVAMAVPFSLIVTLSFLYFMDLSLNILSMMGLMLAIGMLVDNAVVVTENIHRNQNMTGDKKGATVLGVKQVAMAVTAGTFTSIIVFLPNIVSETSMIAIQMYHVAIAIIIALLASLFISLTIIPLLTSHIKPPKQPVKTRFIDNMVNWYGDMLQWLMNRRYLSVGLILGSFLSVAIPLNVVQVDMFPPQASRELYLQYNLNDS